MPQGPRALRPGWARLHERHSGTFGSQSSGDPSLRNASHERGLRPLGVSRGREKRVRCFPDGGVPADPARVQLRATRRRPRNTQQEHFGSQPPSRPTGLRPLVLWVMNGSEVTTASSQLCLRPRKSIQGFKDSVHGRAGEERAMPVAFPRQFSTHLWCFARCPRPHPPHLAPQRLPGFADQELGEAAGEDAFSDRRGKKASPAPQRSRRARAFPRSAWVSKPCGPRRRRSPRCTS